HAQEINHNADTRDELERLIKRADERMEKAYRDKLDRKMPIELCEKIITESTAEKVDLANSLKGLAESRKTYYEAGYAIHELASKAKEIYQSPKATPEEKRLLLSYAFSEIKLSDRELIPKYTLAFDFLATWMPILNEKFEPIQNTAESDALYKTLGFDTTSQAMELLEPRKKIRTSRNPHPNARFSQSTTKSGTLLRG
ncbi:MAG: hypothetical protein HYT34_01300, partial [Candidatus Ryanbacteria bacterium]|nr:hypothetical protein [Candidatus Ryanbacteria bacterium]